MTSKIVLELDAVEAHLLLGAISPRRLEVTRSAAEARTETAREYLDVTAQVLGRVESRICDLMFPEPKVTEYL